MRTFYPASDLTRRAPFPSTFPRGILCVVATLLAITTFLLSTFGSTSCHYLETDLSGTELESVFEEEQFDFGPVMREHVQGFDPEGYQPDCLLWNSQDIDVLFGPALKASRIFAILSYSFIILGMILLFCMSCCYVPDTVIYSIIYAFFVGAVFEILVFVAFADQLVKDVLDAKIGKGAIIAIFAILGDLMTAICAAAVILKTSSRPGSIHPTTELPVLPRCDDDDDPKTMEEVIF